MSENPTTNPQQQRSGGDDNQWTESLIEPQPAHQPHRTGPRIAATVAVIVALVIGVAAGVYWHDTIGGWFGREAQAASGDAQTENGSKQLWTCGMHPQVIQDKPGTCPICHMKLTPLKTDNGSTTTTTAAGGSGAGKERKIKYWWDPMLGPASISDKPGKSAMGMDLVPVYEDEVSGGAAVTIDPVIVQNMGVRVAEVARGPVQRTIRAVGYLDEAQPKIHDVNLRVSGWIEKLYADTEGEHLDKGDPLFDLYSPEVQVAVNELIAAKTAAAPGEDELARKTADAVLQAAQRKLEQWGLDSQDIERLAQAERAPYTVTFRSPITGDVTQKMVVQGAAVHAGDRVLRIVDHSTLWLDAQLYEQDLPFIKLGQKVKSTIESVPGKQFQGEVIFIHPRVDPMTRTATVRMALPNSDLTLRPGMYATAEIRATLEQDALLVPREAVIDTGERQVVFVVAGEGRFEPRKVKLGSPSADGAVQVLEGLAPGDTVVISGQFLFDAESRMKEAIQKHLDQKLLSSRGGGAATGPPPATKEAAPDQQMKWSADVDKVYAEYLKIAQVLGAAQPPEKPLDTAPLIAAAEALVKVTPKDQEQLASNVLQAASAMKDQPPHKQRELFKALSDAVIVMADVCPPSKQIADKLFVLYCPMEKASWLQTDGKVANPYYATEMKSCGEVKRTVQAVPAPQK